MDKIKFIKKFIFIIAVIIINASSLDVYATPPSEDDQIYKNESAILDGEIGEWDPSLKDKPHFDKENLDSDIPQQGDYYTISVTVPISMEFYVLPNSQLAMGSFYSPVYTIKNNGSKNISVKINSFYREKNTATYDENDVPLYVEELNNEDNIIQIELKMCGIEDLDRPWEVTEEIDLTEFKEETYLEKELYTLSANQEKGVTFNAERWELPNNKNAISNFMARFVFSINQ